MEKVIPEVKQSIVHSMDNYEAFVIQDKSNEWNYKGIYLIAILDNQQRALGALKILDQKIIEEKIDIEYEDLIFKALILLEVGQEKDALQVLAEITKDKQNTIFKYWGLHEKSKKVFLNSMPTDKSTEALEFKIKAYLTLNDKVLVKSGLDELEKQTEYHSLSSLIDLSVEIGSDYKSLNQKLLKSFSSSSPYVDLIKIYGPITELENFLKSTDNKALLSFREPEIQKYILQLHEKSLKEDLKFNFDNANHHYSAISYLLNGQKQKALELMKSAINYFKKENDKDALVYIAHIYIKEFNMKAEANELIKGLKGFNNHESLPLLAECYFAIGDLKTGVKILNKISKEKENGFYRSLFDDVYVRLKFLHIDGFLSLTK